MGWKAAVRTLGSFAIMSAVLGIFLIEEPPRRNKNSQEENEKESKQTFFDIIN